MEALITKLSFVSRPGFHFSVEEEKLVTTYSVDTDASPLFAFTFIPRHPIQPSEEAAIIQGISEFMDKSSMMMDRITFSTFTPSAFSQEIFNQTLLSNSFPLNDFFSIRISALEYAAEQWREALGKRQ